MIRTFLTNENGAITVETVVIMALVTALGLATVLLTSGGVEDLSGDMAEEMATQL